MRKITSEVVPLKLLICSSDKKGMQMLLTTSLVMLVGCATIMTSDYQTITLSSSEKETTYYVDGKKVAGKGDSVRVRLNQREYHDFVGKKIGCEEASRYFEKGLSPWIWGNLLLYFLPAIIDFAANNHEVAKQTWYDVTPDCSVRQFLAKILQYFSDGVPTSKVRQNYKSAIQEKLSSYDSVGYQELSDPESLRVRRVKFYTPSRARQKITVACGEYNAKNKMGGYVGYRGFVSNGFRASDRADFIACLCRNSELRNCEQRVVEQPTDTSNSPF